MEDIFFTVLKWTCFGNAIFMLLWMGYRILNNQQMSWIIFDAMIVIVSIVIADRYRDYGV